MGFETCCLLFAAPPVEDDEATLVWTPAAAVSSQRQGQRGKISKDASSNATATANPTKETYRVATFEGRDEATCTDEEEVTLQSYLSSMDDDGDVGKENDGRDGTDADRDADADTCSTSCSCTSQSSRNRNNNDDNDEEAKKEEEANDAPDVSASAEAAVKEAQSVAAEFKRRKRERAISAEFERRRAERAAERERQALEREARQAEARAALLERQRKEKEEADKKRRLTSRAAFEERRKEAEELKRKREDAKRRREQQQAQATFQPNAQQHQQQHQHPSIGQSTARIGGTPNSNAHANGSHLPHIGQQQYQYAPQQMRKMNYTPQKPCHSQPQAQSQTWTRAQHPQSTSPPINKQFRDRTSQAPGGPTVPAPATPVVATSTEEVKRSMLIAWALEPPSFQQLKPIATLVANLQVVLPPAFGVKSHVYFSKWEPLIPTTLQNEDALKKAVRKCRFFLHPDKLPSNLDDLQSFVCKMIWDVMNDAWESHKTGVPVA